MKSCAARLVVDAAVIVAVLLVGWVFLFLPAREKARRNACAQNLRIITSAALAYAQDYDDRYPPTQPNDEWVWYKHAHFPAGGVLEPYLHTSDVNACPADPKWGLRHSDGYSSYRWNASLCGKTATATQGQPLVWDRQPFHSRGRNVGNTDAHVQWLGEREFRGLIRQELRQ